MLLKIQKEYLQVEEFSTFVKKNVPTAGNMRGSAEYRSHLSGVLAGRALQNINRD